MKDTIDYEEMTVFEQIRTGLEQVLAHGRGELTLKTTTLPAPPPEIGSAKVVALRKKLKMSQSVFAAALNVSTKLVQSWEQGSRKPDRGELRLIELLIKHPDVISGFILSDDVSPSPKAARKNKSALKKRSAA